MSTKSARPFGKIISFSQVDMRCGYQLMYRRQRLPATQRSISLVYGTAVGAGIQHHVMNADKPEVISGETIGLQELRKEIAASRLPGGLPIRWDDPPRLTQSGRPYSTELHKIPNREVAEGYLKAHVKAWIERFGDLRAATIEEKAEVPLTRPKGWVVIGYLDIRTTDGGLIDLKTANDQWDEQKLEEAKPQLRYYQAWHRLKFGEPPAWSQFHILIKGSTDIQVIDVPYDAKAVNRWLEHRVRTNITAIEANAFVPNTSGWWHSEKFCDYWHICPLGAAAQPVESQDDPA